MNAKSAKKLLSKKEKQIKKSKKEEDKKRFFNMIVQEVQENYDNFFDYRVVFEDIIVDWHENEPKKYDHFAVDWAINNKKYLEKLGYNVSVSTVEKEAIQRKGDFVKEKRDGFLGKLGFTETIYRNMDIKHKILVRRVDILF